MRYWLLTMLTFLMIQNGFSQKLIVLDSQKSFQLGLDPKTKDTLVYLRLSKPDLKAFRLYVVKLEHIKIKYDYLYAELDITNKKFELLIQEKNNYKNTIILKDRIIALNNQHLEDIRHSIKREKRLAIFKGSTYGLIGGIIICLIIK